MTSDLTEEDLAIGLFGALVALDHDLGVRMLCGVVASCLHEAPYRQLQTHHARRHDHKLRYAELLRNEGWTMRKIVEKTGLARTSLYRHLPPRPVETHTAEDALEDHVFRLEVIPDEHDFRKMTRIVREL